MDVDIPQRHSRCPTGVDIGTWERLCPKIVQTGIGARPKRCEMYTIYTIKGLYTNTVLNIWHIAQQLTTYGIEYQLRVYEDEEYIKTRLVTGHATIYIRLRERQGGSQEVQVGQRGYMTETDYTALIEISGVRIEDGKSTKKLATQ